MTSVASSDEHYKSVDKLAGLSRFLLYLAEVGNDRLTINQGAFFLIAGVADLRGAPLTLTEIMEKGGGVLTKSLKSTYKVLLEPNNRDYKTIGLGWLDREPDPDDERKKYLRLTKKGRSILKAVLQSAFEDS